MVRKDANEHYGMLFNYFDIYFDVVVCNARPFLGQSNPTVKGCIDIMSDVVDTAFSYRKQWSSANFLRNLPR